jgi:hypothetical protein
MRNFIKEFWKSYRFEVILIFVLVLFLLFRCVLFFPILVSGLISIAIKHCNKILKNEEPNFQHEGNLENSIKQAELTTGRLKFIVQYIAIPVFVGFLAYLITDRIYGEKEIIIIGISNSSYSDTIDFSVIYKEKYISKANEMLGGYHPSLQFDIVTISGGYDQIWEALDKNRIDIAFVSPFNFAKKVQDSTIVKFEKRYSWIGGKYTEIGDTYKAGFLMQKKLKDVIRKSNLEGFVKTNDLKIYFLKEQLSTSGRVIPMGWLKSKGITNFDLNNNVGTLPENVATVLNDSISMKSICTFSSDMWHNMKKISPEIASKLHFEPIDEIPIPMDPG